MSGALVGLLLGCGLATVWWSFWPRAEQVGPGRARRHLHRLADDIAVAGLRNVGPGTVVAICLVAGLLTLALVLALTGVPALGLALGAMAGFAPLLYVRSRARRNRASLRDVWPDAIDHVASAVRAGLSLPEALVQLADRGPEPLRAAFAAFAHDYHASGHFLPALDRLKDDLADPVADRLVEAVRITREVGGTDLGRVLRTLSAFLREDARSRAELEARQSWTVNAARLALAAPWVVLLLMATRGTALAAYREPEGALVLAVGAGLSVLAYHVMLRVGRLPVEHRVLR